MTRRNLAVLGGFIVAGALLVLFFGAGGSGSAPRTTTTAPARLAGSARELIDRLNAGRQVTFHVRYAVTSAAAQQGQTVAIELWRKQPLIRQDTIVSGGGPTNQAAAFYGANGATTCTRAGDGPWTCKAAPPGQVPGPDALVAQLTTQLVGVDVTATDESVGGTPSRCYALDYATQKARVCMRADGVVTLVDTPQGRLEATVIDTDVTDKTFEPPVPTS